MPGWASVRGMAHSDANVTVNGNAAFLGSQGDEWDAQKDILCDTFGAVCSATLFLSLNRNEQENCRCIRHK